MRWLTIKQPWADLIAEGVKSLEIRTWATDYRGPMLISASARPAVTVDAKRWPAPDASRLGIAVCVVDLVDCRLATSRDTKAAGGFDPTGQFAWVLERPRRLPPVPVKGGLGLRYAPPELLRSLKLGRAA